MSQKKRDLQQWEKDECAALKEAIAAWNRARPKNQRITQEQAAEALGMNQGSFSNYLNGRLALNFDFALKVGDLFGIQMHEYSERLDKELKDRIAELERLAPEREKALLDLVKEASAKDKRRSAALLDSFSHFFDYCSQQDKDSLSFSVNLISDRIANGQAAHGRQALFDAFYVLAAAETAEILSDQDRTVISYLTESIAKKFPRVALRPGEIDLDAELKNSGT